MGLSEAARRAGQSPKTMRSGVSAPIRAML
jgi:hypothetical protein